MKQILFLTAVLFLILLKSTAQEYGATVREDYPFQVVRTGQASGMKDGDYVFTSQADYITFWNDVFGPDTAPSEVIGEGELLIVLKHTRTSGSVALILGPALETTTNLLMPVRLSNPSFRTADLNDGYTVVKLKNPRKPVVFVIQ